jgi:acetyl-CoA carboxylase biotin carboxyl carrier protein
VDAGLDTGLIRRGGKGLEEAPSLRVRKAAVECAGQEEEREMTMVEVPAPMAGSVKELMVSVGEGVRERQEILLLESMKMEIPVESPVSGTVTEILVGAPEKIDEGQVLLRIEVE